MYTWKTRYFVTAVIGIRLITWAQPSINIYMGVLNVRPDLDYCSLPAFALDRLNSVLQTIYLDRKALSMYTKYFETVWEKRNYVKQSKSRKSSPNQIHSHTSWCYYTSTSRRECMRMACSCFTRRLPPATGPAEHITSFGRLTCSFSNIQHTLIWHFPAIHNKHRLRC